jgi:Pvc16 N-terminal domain
MLADLDRSVAAFLARLLPPGAAIRFGSPAASWAGDSGQSPQVGVFLYDIIETQPPATDGTLTRDADGHAIGWQHPVRRYRVSYLLTAWVNVDALDTYEHELLGAVLVGCAATRVIPDDCLHGTLADAAEPVPLVCAGQERGSDAAWVWPHLGVPMRTALDFMVVAPVVPPLVTELAPGVRDVNLGASRRLDETRPGRTCAARPEHHITEA